LKTTSIFGRKSALGCTPALRNGPGAHRLTIESSPRRKEQQKYPASGSLNTDEQSHEASARRSAVSEVDLEKQDLQSTSTDAEMSFAFKQLIVHAKCAIWCNFEFISNILDTTDL
jgi:hypothetical protein